MKDAAICNLALESDSPVALYAVCDGDHFPYVAGVFFSYVAGFFFVCMLLLRDDCCRDKVMAPTGTRPRGMCATC